MAADQTAKKIAPRYAPPMLATLVEEPFSDKEWIFEKKFDGERCLVVKRGKEVSLYSRNRKKLNGHYPELAEALKKQKKDFVVDGEIVAKNFSSLQKRMQRKVPDKKIPVALYLFDALNVQGVDLRKKPLIERKKTLKRALSFSGKIHYVTHVRTKGVEAFRQAEKKKWEGVIAKRASSQYVSKRSKDWLKFKCAKKETFVIAGFTAPNGSRVGIGALILGHKKDGQLRYAGKVGTGFSIAFLQTLAKKLQRIKRAHSPFLKTLVKGAQFVEPKYFCQVVFTEWTNGGKLRHPRFLKMGKS